MGADCPQVSQFNPVPASPAQSISWSEIDLQYQQNVTSAAQAVIDEQGLTAFITPPLSPRYSPIPYNAADYPHEYRPTSPVYDPVPFNVFVDLAINELQDLVVGELQYPPESPVSTHISLCDEEDILVENIPPPSSLPPSLVSHPQPHRPAPSPLYLQQPPRYSSLFPASKKTFRWTSPSSLISSLRHLVSWNRSATPTSTPSSTKEAAKSGVPKTSLLTATS